MAAIAARLRAAIPLPQDASAADARIAPIALLLVVLAIREQEAQTPPMPKAVGAAAVVRRLRDFAALWASQSDAQRAQMLRNVYERVEVEGPKFVGAHLTADAKELGLTLALPESFVMASPAGVGDVPANIPIAGRRQLDGEHQSA